MIEKNKFYNLPLLIEKLFDRDIELLPSVNELFELELAFLEYNCLPKNCLLDRLAYFKSIEGNLTKHFLMYNKSIKPIINNRSISTKTYFENGLFSTGY